MFFVNPILLPTHFFASVFQSILKTILLTYSEEIRNCSVYSFIYVQYGSLPEVGKFQKALFPIVDLFTIVSLS